MLILNQMQAPSGIYKSSSRIPMSWKLVHDINKHYATINWGWFLKQEQQNLEFPILITTIQSIEVDFSLNFKF